MAPLFQPLRQTLGARRMPVTVRPTDADVAIARTVARKTGPAPQRLARTLTWGADEKVLLALTAIVGSPHAAPASQYGAPPATLFLWRSQRRCCPTA